MEGVVVLGHTLKVEQKAADLAVQRLEYTYATNGFVKTTRVRLDGNGEVLQRVDYEPFGTEVQWTGVSGYSGGSGVTRKFTGKEQDGETGLDYFGARYLGAALMCVSHR